MWEIVTRKRRKWKEKWKWAVRKTEEKGSYPPTVKVCKYLTARLQPQEYRPFRYLRLAGVPRVVWRFDTITEIWETNQGNRKKWKDRLRGKQFLKKENSLLFMKLTKQGDVLSQRERERERERERDCIFCATFMLGVVAKEVNSRYIFLLISRLFQKLLILQNKIHKAYVPLHS